MNLKILYLARVPQSTASSPVGLHPPCKGASEYRVLPGCLFARRVCRRARLFAPGRRASLRQRLESSKSHNWLEARLSSVAGQCISLSVAGPRPLRFSFRGRRGAEEEGRFVSLLPITLSRLGKHVLWALAAGPTVGRPVLTYNKRYR